jgi:hypothetical protein
MSVLRVSVGVNQQKLRGFILRPLRLRVPRVQYTLKRGGVAMQVQGCPALYSLRLVFEADTIVEMVLACSAHSKLFGWQSWHSTYPPFIFQFQSKYQALSGETNCGQQAPPPKCKGPGVRQPCISLVRQLRRDGPQSVQDCTDDLTRFVIGWR